MELLLHYIWKNRLFPWQQMQTTMGCPVEVIDVGTYNTDAGPDFFNAKVKIGEQLWVGNVEMHLKASDWYKHAHEKDAAYNNVVLHVVGQADTEVQTQNGLCLPQMELPIPQQVEENYRHLLGTSALPPCEKSHKELESWQIHAWLDRLLVERLEEKQERVERWWKATAGDWERCFFILLARAFGFGKNSDVFEAWASTILPQQIGKHRDSPLQIEAFFLGQAGLLGQECLPSESDEYFLRLQQEFLFLQHKFALQPLPYSRWKFLRMRPQNFPYRRLVELAHLFGTQQLNFSKICAAQTVKQLRDLLHIKVTGYWAKHYVFGQPKTLSTKRTHTEHPKEEQESLQLSIASKDLLIINAIIPTLFAYARKNSNTELEERVLAWLTQLKAERNFITEAWSKVGMKAENAAESQALIQLHQHYCMRKDCLRCAIGIHFLKKVGK